MFPGKKGSIKCRSCAFWTWLHQSHEDWALFLVLFSTRVLKSLDTSKKQGRRLSSKMEEEEKRGHCLCTHWSAFLGPSWTRVGEKHGLRWKMCILACCVQDFSVTKVVLLLYPRTITKDATATSPKGVEARTQLRSKKCDKFYPGCTILILSCLQAN